MANSDYWSDDARFGVVLPDLELKRILNFCKRAGRSETGGIVVGSYTKDLKQAIITTISDAPRDSRAGFTWFHRGTNGLRQWLDRLWKSRIHYLGEWHFHPFASPIPSGPDISEMVKISMTDSCGCKEPILIIIGGNPANDWLIGVYVFSEGRYYITLCKA